MAISFNNAFGVHEHALKLRTQRAEVIAHNLANADTPNFRARDIDFHSVLRKVKEASDSGKLQLQQTNDKHMSRNSNGSFQLEGLDVELKYRQPTQPSIDGNTVETEQELARFARNAGDFQASMTLLSSRIKSLNGAIKGE